MADRFIYTFNCETAEVQVTHDLGSLDYSCRITPNLPGLPVSTISVTIDEVPPFPFTAAAEALDIYKKKHHLNRSEIWNL